MSQAAKVFEMPVTTKVLPCGKCARDVVVSTKTLMAYCRDCSATLGEKK